MTLQSLQRGQEIQNEISVLKDHQIKLASSEVFRFSESLHYQSGYKTAINFLAEKSIQATQNLSDSISDRIQSLQEEFEKL